MGIGESNGDRIPNEFYDEKNNSLVFRIGESVILESRFPSEKSVDDLMYGARKDNGYKTQGDRN